MMPEENIFTCKPTNMLRKAMSFFPAFTEIDFSYLNLMLSPFPDALPEVEDKQSVCVSMDHIV